MSALIIGNIFTNKSEFLLDFFSFNLERPEVRSLVLNAFQSQRTSHFCFHSFLRFHPASESRFSRFFNDYLLLTNLLLTSSISKSFSFLSSTVCWRMEEVKFFYFRILIRKFGQVLFLSYTMFEDPCQNTISSVCSKVTKICYGLQSLLRNFGSGQNLLGNKLEWSQNMLIRIIQVRLPSLCQGFLENPFFNGRQTCVTGVSSAVCQSVFPAKGYRVMCFGTALCLRVLRNNESSGSMNQSISNLTLR